MVAQITKDNQQDILEVWKDIDIQRYFSYAIKLFFKPNLNDQLMETLAKSDMLEELSQ